jgi:hypothetical protein
MIIAAELLPAGAVDRIAKITGVVRAERRWKATP